MLRCFEWQKRRKNQQKRKQLGRNPRKRGVKDTDPAEPVSFFFFSVLEISWRLSPTK
jgi:hypothetical protein